MSGNFFLQKTILEQIYDEMFAQIKNDATFEPEAVEKLHRMAREGGLNRASQVVEAIGETQVKEP